MTSNPEFNSTTGAVEAAAALSENIRSKTVLITGVNSGGLGAQAAYAAALQNPGLLILTYRSKEKVEKVVAELKDAFPSVQTATVYLNLVDMNSIRAAAKEVHSLTKHIDVLINNAGVMSVQKLTLTPNGTEIHFATNHIGHFLFTNLIMDLLRIAARKARNPGSTRVINVSGAWHQFSPVRFDDINFSGTEIPQDQKPNLEYLAKFGHDTESNYIPEVAYSQPKTANILFSTYLTRQLNDVGIISLALNPGGVMTEIARHLPQETIDRLLAMDVVDKTLDQGAAPIIVAAFNPTLTAETVYLHDCQPLAPKSYANDNILAEKLWHLSEDLVGQKFALKE